MWKTLTSDNYDRHSTCLLLMPCLFLASFFTKILLRFCDKPKNMTSILTL